MTNFPIRTNTWSLRLGDPCHAASQPPFIMCTRMGRSASWLICRWLCRWHMGSAGKPVVSTSNIPSPPLLQPPTSRRNRPKTLTSEVWTVSPAYLTSAEPQLSSVLCRSLQVLARATQLDPWPRRPGDQGTKGPGDQGTRGPGVLLVERPVLGTICETWVRHHGREICALQRSLHLSNLTTARWCVQYVACCWLGSWPRLRPRDVPTRAPKSETWW